MHKEADRFRSEISVLCMPQLGPSLKADYSQLPAYRPQCR